MNYDNQALLMALSIFAVCFPIAYLSIHYISKKIRRNTDAN
jgi:peptidoglycan/LPS O-acetylase OafA/YrhL